MLSSSPTADSFRPDPPRSSTSDHSGRTIVFDVRCLQDANYAGRGVGRHALALLRGAPRDASGDRLVGLIDPDLPPLLQSAREVLHATTPNAYAASIGFAPDCFVALSPMTHDPIYIARLLGDDSICRLAVVYDFIPQRWPERYLSSPAERLSYAVSLKWLSQYDGFMAISQSTADDLSRFIGTPKRDVHVIGCALNPMFERIRPAPDGQARDHVLVVGGADPRKNPEVVIRAHARSTVLQSHRISLVICGNYGAAEAATFGALAASCGGRPDLLEVPGHVSDRSLMELYSQALAIVSSSRDEGFSLPLVEGMAAHLPCLASDIPAHRELVDDPARRFAPDDDEALRLALERICDDDTWRNDVVERQASVWPKFRARDVSRSFWMHVPRGRSKRRPAFIGRSAQPRVAFLSPVPPDRSGVADYTAATCAELGRRVDLHVFTGAREPHQVVGAAAVNHLSALPHVSRQFDRVVSVMGNSHFHLEYFRLLDRYGGACISHDSRLLGFYKSIVGKERAAQVASRELGRDVTDADLSTWEDDESTLEALFLGELAERASPTIVHSRTTKRLIRERYRVDPVFLPFSIYHPWTPSELTSDARKLARKRLGLRKNEVAIATFGFVHMTKAPEDCIWALDILRGWGVPATLHFVGGLEIMWKHGAELRALVDQLGMAAHVRFIDSFVSEQTYRDYLAGADLGIQLRTFGMGAVSGALLDCAAAGLPTVSNMGLADAVEVPPGYSRAIPDSLSPLLLAEALMELRERNTAVGAAATREAERQAFSENRSFRVYSRKLCEALHLETLEPGDIASRSA